MAAGVSDHARSVCCPEVCGCASCSTGAQLPRRSTSRAPHEGCRAGSRCAVRNYLLIVDELHARQTLRIQHRGELLDLGGFRLDPTYVGIMLIGKSRKAAQRLASTSLPKYESI